MSQAHDAAGAALGSARVSHNFYFRSLPQLLKDSPDSRAASKGNRFTLWQGVLYPPASSSSALLLPRDGSSFWDSPVGGPGPGRALEGFYFLWVIKRSGINGTCFPHFLAKPEIVQTGTNHRRGGCHLEYVDYWVSHV